jgi:hypothetical protein
LTCLFTTLKYYPSNSSIFNERLLRYARTLNCPDDSLIVFEYIHISKTPTQFEYAAVSEYVVDLVTSEVSERVLDPLVNVRAAHEASPLHEGARPGSYVALGS